MWVLDGWEIADWSYPKEGVNRGFRIIRLRVWGGDKASRALQAHLRATFRETRAAFKRGEILPGTIVVDNSYVLIVPGTIVVDNSYILPHDVRVAIEYGLTHGWDPESTGQPFLLTAADALSFESLELVDIV